MLTTDKYLLFWGDEDIYSNFYPAEFDMYGIHFYWSEQAFIYQKAMRFNDIETADKILAMNPVANQPIDCKKLGRLVKNFDEVVWFSTSYNAMVDACYAKFSGNKLLREQLLATGDLILVEASPYDKIWGIGLSETDPDVQDESKWKGTNLLGKALMQVRDELHGL